MHGAFLIAQYSVLLAESDESELVLPLYRAPIAYERKKWSLAEAGWGDTEYLEYPRFSPAEIRALIVALGLARVGEDKRGEPPGDGSPP